MSEDLSAQFASWVPVRGWLVMLLAVPFLPPQLMADALEELVRAIPKDVRKTLHISCFFIVERLS